MPHCQYSLHHRLVFSDCAIQPDHQVGGVACCIGANRHERGVGEWGSCMSCGTLIDWTDVVQQHAKKPPKFIRIQNTHPNHVLMRLFGQGSLPRGTADRSWRMFLPIVPFPPFARQRASSVRCCATLEPDEPMPIRNVTKSPASHTREPARSASLLGVTCARSIVFARMTAPVGLPSSSKRLADAGMRRQTDIRNAVGILVCSFSHIVHGLGIVHRSQ